MDSNHPLITGEKQLSKREDKPVLLENESSLSISSSLLSAAAGLALIFLAATNDYFWNDEKTFLNAKFCLPLSLIFGLILIGSFINSKWKISAFWSALALVGQAASLQMINAGRLIHFQHYRSLSELFGQDVLALFTLAVQIGLVAFGIGQHLPKIKSWLGKTFQVWQVILIALFLMFSGAAVTPDVSIYTTSLLTAAVVQLVNLANIVLIARSVPDESIVWLREKIAVVFRNSHEITKPRLDKFSILAAIWIVFLSGSLSYFIYQNHPHVPDETQYLFQAKYLAAGQITVKAPLVPEAFAMYMTPYQEERWFGVFPPGWSAMLAIGEKLNVVWLVNPLLAGLCILLSYLFFQEVYSRSFARIAVLLLCCSPWFVFMAMSFMSHIFTLVCALGAAVLLSRALKKQKILYVFAAGLMVGIVSLIRPLDGAIVAVLLGVWTLFGFQNRCAKIRNGLALVAGTITTAALIFPYNKSITGNAMLSPMDFYYTKYFWSGVMSPGFGANRGFHWGLDAFPGHSPLEAIINAALDTFLLNTELFGWGIGSLVLATCFLFSGSLQKKDAWMLGVIITVIGGYSLFWYHGGPDFGARYWFLCIIPLIALTVRGIQFVSVKLNAESEMNPRVILTVGILCTISLFAYFPWRALDKYYNYLEMRPDIRQLARQNNFGKSLVMIRGEEHPDYQSAWIYNPLNFEGDAPIYAWDKDEETRTALLQTYPNRPVWIIDGPTRTGSGYKIVQRPDDAQELSAKENQ